MLNFQQLTKGRSNNRKLRNSKERVQVITAAQLNDGETQWGTVGGRCEQGFLGLMERWTSSRRGGWLAE